MFGFVQALPQGVTIIQVRREHIEGGTQRSHSNCAIARAVTAHFPDAFVVHVTRDAIYVHLMSRRVLRADTNWRARLFIRRFDAGLWVWPTNLKLAFTAVG